jgi:Uma2 family endonuclease
MAETGIHVQAIMLLHQALEDFFRDRPDVFLASDMFWYFVEGNPKARIAPDVMVVPGVGNRSRRSFFTWSEGGAVPAVVFEMASEKTWKVDLGKKSDRYASLGVREYFVFDPEELYLVAPPLRGFRLRAGKYAQMRPTGGDWVSKLGFRMRPEGMMLRLINDATGEPIPTRAEAVEQAQANLRQAEAEVERLRAMLRQRPKTGNGA